MLSCRSTFSTPKDMRIALVSSIATSMVDRACSKSPSFKYALATRKYSEASVRS